MIELRPDDFKFFVTESNRIEGIHRPPTHRELEAHSDLLGLGHLTVADIEAFVQRVAGKPLRTKLGMNVRVGDHIAPPGGPHIAERLDVLLSWVRDGIIEPHEAHLEYETLHPFMDGNGRSGRALWLWQMLNQHDAYHALRMGFLHLFYYQTLAAIPKRQAEGSPEAAQVER